MDKTTILQIIIGVFGVSALALAVSVMNKSEKKGFGPNNKQIFGSILILCFAGFLLTVGGDGIPAGTALIGTVAGFYGATKMNDK